MRHAAGQSADGFQFLRLSHLVFQLAPLFLRLDSMQRAAAMIGQRLQYLQVILRIRFRRIAFDEKTAITFDPSRIGANISEAERRAVSPKRTPSGISLSLSSLRMSCAPVAMTCCTRGLGDADS